MFSFVLLFKISPGIIASFSKLKTNWCLVFSVMVQTVSCGCSSSSARVSVCRSRIRPQERREALCSFLGFLRNFSCTFGNRLPKLRDHATILPVKNHQFQSLTLLFLLIGHRFWKLMQIYHLLKMIINYFAPKFIVFSFGFLFGDQIIIILILQVLTINTSTLVSFLRFMLLQSL